MTLHRRAPKRPLAAITNVLPVEFTVLGIPCLGLNEGPMMKHSEAFSFQVATTDQAESDRDPVVAKRTFEAMMHMKKIDVAAIEATRCG